MAENGHLTPGGGQRGSALWGASGSKRTRR